MIELPPLLIEPPAIIRPLEGGLWGDIDRKMQGLGLPRGVRRGVIAEMKKVAGGKPGIVKATAQEMARYGGDPSLASMLVNPFAFGVPAVPMVYSYEGSTLDNGNATTYTFTNHAIGAAGAGRVVAVAVRTRTTSIGTPRSISGVTAGGNAMTAGPFSTGGSNGSSTIGWFYLVIAAGTTSTLVVTFNSGTQNCDVGVYRLFPVSSTPVDTDSFSSASPATLSNLEVKTQGLVLMLVESGRANATGLDSFSWGGVDTPVQDLTNQQNDQTSGLNLFSIPTTENDVTRDFTATDGGNVLRMAGMSFQ